MSDQSKSPRPPSSRKLRSSQWATEAIAGGDFSRYQLGIVHDWLETLTLLAAILVPLFLVLDSVMIPRALLTRFALTRGISGALALIQFFVVRATRPSRWSYLHGYLISAQVGGIIAFMTTTLGGFASSYYAGLNLVVIGVNLLMPWRARHTAANALLILLMYVGFNLAMVPGFPVASFLNNLFFLGATTVVAVAINYVRFRLLRRDFALLVEVRRAHDELQGKKDLVEDRTRSLKSLLDVSGQGFLSIDKDFIVGPEYSRECEKILGTQRVEGAHIDELLYEDPRARADFRNGLRLYFVGSAKPEVIFDLLDHTLRIKEKTVRVEYRAVHAGRVMAVLTDITEELRMQELSREENARKATLLKVIANRNAFGIFNREADSLFVRLTGRDDDFESLVRDIHTFKGNAGFLGFQKTQEAAHDLEDFLKDRLALEQSILPGEKIGALIDAYTTEVSIITDGLGSSWLRTVESVEIPRSDYLALETYVLAHYPQDRALLEALESNRKVPLVTLFDRFPEMAGDLAVRTGKRIGPLAVTGGELRVIPEHFEGLVDSFGHLVRNMVDHGIEPPGEREVNGKEPEGRLSIDIRESPAEIVFVFSDDGRGVQLDRVAARAMKLGLLKQGEEPTPRALLSLIFRDNFSTVSRVTNISGRGVGLAAVRAAVQKLGGRIAVKSLEKRGTTFTISIPRERVRQGEAVA
jgi:HPt (histidine-containing phosphotransfer) domain-containing protein